MSLRVVSALLWLRSAPLPVLSERTSEDIPRSDLHVSEVALSARQLGRGVAREAGVSLLLRDARADDGLVAVLPVDGGGEFSKEGTRRLANQEGGVRCLAGKAAWEVITCYG